jgi:hypothetical protein
MLSQLFFDIWLQAEFFFGARLFSQHAARELTTCAFAHRGGEAQTSKVARGAAQPLAFEL